MQVSEIFFSSASSRICSIVSIDRPRSSTGRCERLPPTLSITASGYEIFDELAEAYGFVEGTRGPRWTARRADPDGRR